MSNNPALYRYVSFIGGRILDAQNVSALQAQTLLRNTHGLGSLYADGTMLNAHFSISGTNITLNCANNTYPVLIFIRGAWETLITAGGSTAVPALPSTTPSTYPLYINWSLDIKTGSDDSNLLDGSTGEETVQMGQLSMTISFTDTSATSLNAGIQFEKNTTPIEIAAFSVDSFTTVSPVYINGIYPYALATTKQAGLVNLTDDSGKAAGNTDARLSDRRSPIDRSVMNSSVATLIATNTGVTPNEFDTTAPNQGGIFSDSIIYKTLKYKLTDFLDNVQANITSAIASLAAHIGQPLGAGGTHPFPTANQVGATPSSHIGTALGLATSHPAQVNDDHAGFIVLRNSLVTPASTDYGYKITDGTNVKSGLLHNGDVFSALANTITAAGGSSNGGTAINTGTLGSLLLIAKVLAEHVGYKTHGANNPHNLNASDIGSASQAYVDTQDTSVLSQAEAYTDAATGVSIRAQTDRSSGATFTPSGTKYFGWPSTSSMHFVILKLGAHFEVAIGSGQIQHAVQVPLPEASGWNSSTFLGFASPGQVELDYEASASWKFSVDNSTRIVTAEEQSQKHGSKLFQIANVLGFYFRTV